MYEGKKNTNKWYPVILISSADFKTQQTGKAFGDITTKYSYEAATSLSTLTMSADNWKEAGEGKYWLRIGASEFTSEGKYEVSVACSGSLTFNFLVEVRDKTVAEMMDDIDTLKTRISGVINIAGGLVEANVKQWDGSAVTKDVNNLPDVNTKAISADLAAADNLESILDTTGGHLTLKSNTREPLLIEPTAAFDAVSIKAYAAKRAVYIDSQAASSQGIYLYGETPLKSEATAGFACMLAGVSGAAALRIQTTNAPAIWILGAPCAKMEVNSATGNCLEMITSGGSSGTGIYMSGFYQGLFMDLQTGAGALYGIRIKSRLSALRAESTTEYGIEGIGLLAGVRGLGTTNGKGAIFQGVGGSGAGIEILSDYCGINIDSEGHGIAISAINRGVFVTAGDIAAYFESTGSEAMYLKATAAEKSAFAAASLNGPGAAFNSYGVSGNYPGIQINGQGSQAGILSVGGLNNGDGMKLSGQGTGKDINAKEIDGIKTKTDLLPPDPADASDIYPACNLVIEDNFNFTGPNLDVIVQAKNSALDFTATEKASIQTKAVDALTSYDAVTVADLDAIESLAELIKEVLVNETAWDFTSSPNYGILYIKNAAGTLNKYSQKCYKENGVDKPANSQEVAVRKEFTII